MRLDPDSLLAECTAGLQLLGRWLEGESTEEEIKTFYRDLGARRRSQGVELHEMLSAVMLLKKQIWTYARSQGVWQRPVEMYRVMELQSRFAVFFDKAMYQSARGFEGGLSGPQDSRRPAATPTLDARGRLSAAPGRGGTGGRCYTLKRKLMMSPSATM